MVAPSYVKQITKAGQTARGTGAEETSWRSCGTARSNGTTAIGGSWPPAASTEPDLFFPIGTTGPAVDQIEAAKRVCRGCDALEPCLDFALATNQESGVWGGTSEEERRKLRKSWLAARRRAS